MTGEVNEFLEEEEGARLVEKVHQDEMKRNLKKKKHFAISAETSIEEPRSRGYLEKPAIRAGYLKRARGELPHVTCFFVSVSFHPSITTANQPTVHPSIYQHCRFVSSLLRSRSRRPSTTFFLDDLVFARSLFIRQLRGFLPLLFA